MSIIFPIFVIYFVVFIVYAVISFLWNMESRHADFVACPVSVFLHTNLFAILRFVLCLGSATRRKTAKNADFIGINPSVL